MAPPFQKRTLQKQLLAIRRTDIFARIVDREYQSRTARQTLTYADGRPIYTSVSEKPDIVFVKGGLFAKAGHKLPLPFKEQFWRRREPWERAYASEDMVIE